jgi:hypothetical protein
MNQIRNNGLQRWVLLGAFTILFCIVSSEAKAIGVSYKTLNVNFHGYFESNLIFRDTSGFQNGFMNDLEVIQQRNTLKFDVDVHPELRLGSFSLDKFHFTYRGAYDTIFDITSSDRYDDIQKQNGPSRFDLGLDDIQVENDLREAFLDVVYSGSLGTAFLRPGRQIISWGETMGVTIIDSINPSDNSFQMFFLNPDDLKIPLWMVRLNYNLPPMKLMYLNIDFLVIPEIRPIQFGPLDESMASPYVSILPFAMFGEFGIIPKYDVPTNNTAFALKLTADIGSNLSVSAVYLKHLAGSPGLTVTNFGLDLSQPFLVRAKAELTFNMTETYGGFFNYYFELLDIVLNGEIGYTTHEPVPLPLYAPDFFRTDDRIPLGVRLYRIKPVTRWMLGFGKDLRWRWFSDTNVNFVFQWIHTSYGDWEDVFTDQWEEIVNETYDKDSDLFVSMLNWYWMHSKINPVIAFMADPRGNFMSQTSVTWTINTNWYAKVAGQAFWGKKDTKSAFRGFVDGPSELTFKVGFQW